MRHAGNWTARSWRPSPPDSRGITSMKSATLSAVSSSGSISSSGFSAITALRRRTRPRTRRNSPRRAGCSTTRSSSSRGPRIHWGVVGVAVPDERSLEQVENDYWGDAPADATRLIQAVHELRRRPIGDLAVEDLRVLIGQQVGVDALMPLVLDRLERDPLAEGDYYAGDLLVAVLGVSRDYWERHPEQR